MRTKLKEILESKGISTSLNVLDNVQWKTSECSLTSILFYQFNKHSIEERELCRERLNDCEFGICLNNSSKDLNLESVYSVSDDDLKTLKEELLNELYPYDKKLKFKP